jgi:hypothetical protein
VRAPICQNARVEGILLAVGIVLGWTLAQLGLSVQSVRDRRLKWVQEKRQLYARALGLSDLCYQLAGSLVRYEEFGSGATGKRTLEYASRELDATLKSGRMLFSEIRLVAPSEVIEAAEPLHRSAEEAFLVITMTSSVGGYRGRWPQLDVRWRAAREEFVEAARADLR